MTIEPTTALTLAVIQYREADVVTVTARAAMLAAAGQAYLDAETAGKVPAREERRYTNQLAHAAINIGQRMTRKHERDEAIGHLDEIDALATAELRAERNALKKKAATEPAEAKPLNEERYDVRLGLVG